MSLSAKLLLTSCTAILAVGVASPAWAQSGSRIYSTPPSQVIQNRTVPMGSGTIIQGQPVQSGLPIQRGSTMQGSTTQAIPMQGSGRQGSGMQGQVIQGTPMQGSTSQGSTTMQGSGSGTMMKAAPQSFESKFWRYLNEARFREWAPAPGTSGDAYAGQSPHGAMLKMYLNRKAAGLSNELPVSSVVVKENYAADGTTLMAITTMYRAKGYDAGGTGWYWTKYNPDGSVAIKDGKKLAGKVQGCIDCHAGAAGGDYVFFND